VVLDVQTSELLLVGLLVGSNVFWMLNTHKLINKLMSRNYFEFKSAELKPDEKSDTIKLQPDEIEDFGALSELTRL
jgi:hypothetical protein